MEHPGPVISGWGRGGGAALPRSQSGPWPGPLRSARPVGEAGAGGGGCRGAGGGGHRARAQLRAPATPLPPPPPPPPPGGSRASAGASFGRFTLAARSRDIMPKRKVRRPGCAAVLPPRVGSGAPSGGPERRPAGETRIRGRGCPPLSRRRSVLGLADGSQARAFCCLLQAPSTPPRRSPPPVYFPGAARGGGAHLPGGEVAITTPAPIFLLLPLRRRGEALQQLRLRPWPPREEFPARKLRRRGGEEAAPTRGGRIPPPLPVAPERWLRGKREEGRGKPCLKQTTPFSSPPAADPYVPTPAPIRAGPLGAGGGASRGSAGGAVRGRGSRAGLWPRRCPIPALRAPRGWQPPPRGGAGAETAFLQGAKLGRPLSGRARVFLRLPCPLAAEPWLRGRRERSGAGTRRAEAGGWHRHPPAPAGPRGGRPREALCWKSSPRTWCLPSWALAECNGRLDTNTCRDKKMIAAVL